MQSCLNYADDKYFKLPESPSFEPIALPDSSNVLFVTNPAHDFGFRAGVLNSVVNGRYVVVVEPGQVNKVLKHHEGKVDLVATEEIHNLNESVNLFVPKGSGLLKGHAKRT